MSLKKILWMATTAVALQTGLATTAVAQSQDPVRIGALLSTTGGLAGLGIPQRDGILLAQKLINADGGINGRPVEVILEDDATNPDAALTKVNTLVHSQKVAAIIGPTGIAQTVAIGSVTQPLNIPVLAFTGIGPAVEKSRDCVFHLTPAQELNAKGLLAYAQETGAKRIGVLHDSGYGQVIWGAMSKLGADYGVEFVGVEKFELSATDATAQAAKVKATEPDAVIVLSSLATPFRNLRQVGLTAPIISVHGTATYDIVKAMGAAADNIIHAEFLIAEDPQPYQTDFVAAYQKEHGQLPKHFEAAGYDALMAIAAAMKKSGDTGTNGALCKELRAPYQGAFALYDFSAEDLGGLKLESFNYSLLTNGKFSRLPFKASE